MFLADNGSHRALPSIFDEFARILEPLESHPAKVEKRSAAFPVDVSEMEDQYEISVSLPGVGKDQIEISLEERTLEIAVTAPEQGCCSGKYLLQERQIPSGTRKFSLPEVADEGGVAASFENGVLRITVPKQAKKEPVKITVS
jgi:HSP20 family protein